MNKDLSELLASNFEEYVEEQDLTTYQNDM